MIPCADLDTLGREEIQAGEGIVRDDARPGIPARPPRPVHGKEAGSDGPALNEWQAHPNTRIDARDRRCGLRDMQRASRVKRNGMVKNARDFGQKGGIACHIGVQIGKDPAFCGGFCGGEGPKLPAFGKVQHFEAMSKVGEGSGKAEGLLDGGIRAGIRRDDDFKSARQWKYLGQQRLKTGADIGFLVACGDQDADHRQGCLVRHSSAPSRPAMAPPARA